MVTFWDYSKKELALWWSVFCKAPVCYEVPACTWISYKWGFCYWTTNTPENSRHVHVGKVYISLWLITFSQNGSPGQTTMLTRRASKFCAKPRSPFSEISHHDPKTIGKTPKTGPLPECQPELLGYVHFTFFFTLFSYYFHIFVKYVISLCSIPDGCSKV